MLLLLVKRSEARGARYFRCMSLTPDDEVRSRDELVSFVRELRQDYLRRGYEWENQSLDRFLEALAAWMHDSPGWYQKRREGTPRRWGLDLPGQSASGRHCL
ncbi:DUF7660 family protein [Streptomyces sp. TSRI0281]|uniref:DUF7660 family protein n=1 Tax=Streptomyces sp. TSRI0281 TaxID=1718998 RepID=UPI003FD680A7